MCLCVQGTSRGGADITEIVKRLKLWGVNQLYVVGGNGGNAAANAIQKECEVRTLSVSQEMAYEMAAAVCSNPGPWLCTDV